VTIDFLTPLAGLVVLLVALPLAAILLRERSFGRVRALLGLTPPDRRVSPSVAIALGLLFALLGIAAAQPVIRLDDPLRARTDAEAFVVVDASRSMLAAAAPGAPTRFARAVRAGLELRSALADVPTGVASMTDRPLPHLFPTVDHDVFGAVMRRSLGIDRPPPSNRQSLATDLGALRGLAEDNYFSAQSVRRLAVVLTDGESRPFELARLESRLRKGGVDLMLVRFWDERERVWRADGSPEPGYRPDPAAGDSLAALAAAAAGGRVFGEEETAAIVEAAREYLGTGPTVAALERRRSIPLGGWFALAAAVPLAFLLVRGDRLPRARATA
jgi:hypothetical protein